MTFRRFLACCCLILASMLPAEARLGETLEECVTRYGSFYGKIPARTLPDGEICYLFEKGIERNGIKSKIKIRIEFYKGKAWYIRYSGKMTESERVGLMALGMEAETWSAAEMYRDRLFWKSSGENPRFASEFKLSDASSVLDLYDAACAGRLKAQREAIYEAVVKGSMATPSPANKTDVPTSPTEGKTGVSPLPGF
jgi:hypothetical protein